MHGYSIDLRQRVVQAYLAREGTQTQLAHRFKVSSKTVYNWIKRFRETGSLQPKGHAGGGQPKLDANGIAYLQHLIDEQPDATLAELANRLEAKLGVRLHESTVWRYSERLKQTYKKNDARQ